MKHLFEYFSSNEKISSIDEYLLSNKNKKIKDYSEISEQFSEEFKEYLTDIYSDDEYIYMMFENLQWKLLRSPGMAYIYSESESKIWLTSISGATKDRKRKGWWLEDDSEGLTYKRAGQFVNRDLHQKIERDEIIKK